MLLYLGAKSNKSKDHHTEMNWDLFSEWCRTKIFPAIARTGQKSVVLLDRATCHTKLSDDDRFQVTLSNNPRTIDATMRWGGAPDHWPLTSKWNKTKSQLLEFARSIYPPPVYEIQKIANECSISGFHVKVLFLPVAHPELNLIEVVWSIVKRNVAGKNLRFSLNDVDTHVMDQISKVTAEYFKKYASHAKKEDNYS